MRERLEERLQISSYSLSYPPGPGIMELSGRIRDLLGTISADAVVHLVGHSLGGLVLRHVARGAHDSRIVQTISLAAPFRGSARNWLVPGQAGRDLSQGSEILHELSSATAVDEGLPHLALVAEEDRMIIPGAYPDYGDHAMIPRTGHNGILFSEEAIARVVERIAHPQRAMGST
jgi:pimeloyl-ACP methyl ester carboxylesterase